MNKIKVRNFIALIILCFMTILSVARIVSSQDKAIQGPKPIIVMTEILTDKELTCIPKGKTKEQVFKFYETDTATVFDYSERNCRQSFGREINLK